jgi:hypothetical protein
MTTWESWQSEWAGASGTLPDLDVRVRAEVRRHRRARVTVALLLAAAALSAIPAFAAPEAPVHAIGWGILGFCVAMAVGFVLTRRDVRVPGLTAPRVALAFLQGRLEAERRAAHVARWVYLVACILGAVATHLLYEEHGSPLPVRIMTLGCFAFGLLLSLSAPWWFGVIARRRQAEIDGWRRWMDEQGL